MQDYSVYRYAPKEVIRYALQGLAAAIIIGYLFYRSLTGIVLLSPIILFYLKKKRKSLILLRKWKLNLEFRDGLAGLAAALSAGYSAENAFEEVLKDLGRLYHKNTMIIREFTLIHNQLRMNITVEKALTDFGERTGIEDIISFAEVFTTAKRTGGDLVQIIQTTSNTISDKLEIKREILTLVAAKKYEADLMKIIPPGMIGYLTLTSPEFLKPLYHNFMGVMAMTLLLFLYLGAYLAVEKIITIEV